MSAISRTSPRQEVVEVLTSNSDFEAFVAPHLPVLRALAAREVGTGDSEDVVQDALVRAWTRRATYREDLGSARAWLCAIVMDQCRRRRIRRRQIFASNVACELLDLEDGAELRVDVEQAVANLPRRQRQVVTLHYLADLSVDEVAFVLGVTPGTVKGRLFSARRNLRHSLRGSIGD